VGPNKSWGVSHEQNDDFGEAWSSDVKTFLSAKKQVPPQRGVESNPSFRSSNVRQNYGIGCNKKDVTKYGFLWASFRIIIYTLTKSVLQATPARENDKKKSPPAGNSRLHRSVTSTTRRTESLMPQPDAEIRSASTGHGALLDGLLQVIQSTPCLQLSCCRLLFFKANHV
jgi:hypothetical protein